MATFQFTFSNNLPQFHDELIAAEPDCAPVRTAVPGQFEPRCLVSGLGDDVQTTVPDTVTEAEVQAVVDVHVPDPLFGKAMTLAEFRALNPADQEEAIYSRIFQS